MREREGGREGGKERGGRREGRREGRKEGRRKGDVLCSCSNVRDGRRRAAEASGARRENSGGRGGKRGRRAAEARGAQSVNSRGWVGSGARRGARRAARNQREVGRERCEARRAAGGT